ncbi:hypothetical protein D3C71_1808010 [compost metagenome]
MDGVVSTAGATSTGAVTTASVAKTGIGALSTGAASAGCRGGDGVRVTGTSIGGVGGLGTMGLASGTSQRSRTASLWIGTCDSGINSKPKANACRARAVL